MSQFILPFSWPPSYAARDFIVSACNRLAYDWVMRWPDWPARALGLSGPAASGKTHLAHLWAQRAGASFLPPERLEEASGACVIDGDWTEWDETALFHLLNRLKDADGWLLLCHPLPPSRWGVRLPDLASRLNALPHVAIAEADDALLEALLFKHCADRQLQVTPEVLRFLLSRCERSAQAAEDLIARLDDASLQQGRTITLPFASKFLSENSLFNTNK